MSNLTRIADKARRRGFSGQQEDELKHYENVVGFHSRYTSAGLLIRTNMGDRWAEFDTVDSIILANNMAIESVKVEEGEIELFFQNPVKAEKDGSKITIFP